MELAWFSCLVLVLGTHVSPSPIDPNTNSMAESVGPRVGFNIRALQGATSFPLSSPRLEVSFNKQGQSLLCAVSPDLAPE